jgi:hypothetical protein
MLIICASSPTFAQKEEDEVEGDNSQVEAPHKAATVKWGPELKKPSGTKLGTVLASDANGFYSYRFHYSNMSLKEGDPVLEYYGRNCKLIKSKDLIFKYQKEDLDFKKFVFLGDNQIWALCWYYNRSKKITYLFAQKINNKTLEQEGEMLKLDEVEGKNNREIDIFGTTISSDSSKLLIASRTAKIIDGKGEITIHVFDPNMKELWYRDVKLPYEDENFLTSEVEVDNDGNAYLLGILFDRKAKKSKDLPNYSYSLFSFSNNKDEKEHEYKISLKDKFIVGLSFSVTSKKELVCAGFYSNRILNVGEMFGKNYVFGNSSEAGLAGTYFIRINTLNKEVLVSKTKEFSLDLITTHLSDRKKEKARTAKAMGDKKNQAELGLSYRFREIIQKSDGGVVLIMEKFYIVSKPYNGHRDYIDYYHYDDIIVASVSPTGDIQWTKRIPKEQVTKEDGGVNSSYSVSVVGDKLYFLFNDNPDNYKPGNTKQHETSGGKNSTVALAVLDADGKLSLKPLLNNSDLGNTTKPKACRQVSQNETIMYAQRGSTYRFATIKFQ